MGGDPNIFYYHGYFELAEDEALVIEVERIPECRAWNLQTDNYWMESLDYRYHRIHLNKHTAKYRADGGVTMVLAHRDPGVDNWLDTAGHRARHAVLSLDRREGVRASDDARGEVRGPEGVTGVTVDKLDGDALAGSRARETGLEDFGDPSFREPMRRLIEALNGEARLNDAGRAYFAERIGNVLITRLRAEDWFRRHPEILEEEIGAPLAIVGLPRTGTTMMHRTIASDHRMYSPLWYEVRYPAPLPGTDFATGTDPRIARGRGRGARDARDLARACLDPPDGRARAGRGHHAAGAVLLQHGAGVLRAPAAVRRRGSSGRTSARATAT